MTEAILEQYKSAAFEKGVRYALDYLREVYGEGIEETDIWAQFMTFCEDCEAVTAVTFEPYGSGKMAVISCPNCGISYDTNLDESEGNL
jgi:lysyl-tRNA synthetase class I